jgi:hypothetical protein
MRPVAVALADGEGVARVVHARVGPVVGERLDE